MSDLYRHYGGTIKYVFIHQYKPVTTYKCLTDEGGKHFISRTGFFPVWEEGKELS